jgi:hypothetical protein
MFVWIAVIAISAVAMLYGAMEANATGVQLSPTRAGSALLASLDNAAQSGTCTAGPTGCSCTGDRKCESHSTGALCYSDDPNNKGRCTKMRCTQTTLEGGSTSCTCNSESNVDCPSTSS